MTILPTIISGIFSLILLIHFRRSFKRHILDAFMLRHEWVYLFDAIAAFSIFTRFLLRFGNELMKGPWLHTTITASYVAMGFIGLFILVLLLFDLEEFYQYIGRKFFKRPMEDTPSSRRQFLKKNLAFATLAGSTLVTGVGVANSFDPKVVAVTIPLKNSHKNLSGLKIVQLSDVHIGPTLKRDFAEMLVERVNALNPDVIVITGDLIDGTVADIGEELIPFKNFKSRLGTYFVTGNHEYYWYAREWIEYSKKLGMRPLVNENIQLEHNGFPFYLAGVNDVYSKRVDPEFACDLVKAQQSIPVEAYSILLSHQPKTCFEATKLKYNLQLSGHTHGGQGFPWNLIVHLVQPYIKGLHLVEDMHLYVSTGTGFWGPPNRFMINSEITEITFS